MPTKQIGGLNVEDENDKVLYVWRTSVQKIILRLTIKISQIEECIQVYRRDAWRILWQSLGWLINGEAKNGARVFLAQLLKDLDRYARDCENCHKLTFIHHMLSNEL